VTYKNGDSDIVIV